MKPHIRIRSRLAAGWALLSSALPLAAHPGHYHPPGEVDEFDSFAAGFAHPLAGADHALLSIAIGWLLLSRLNRTAIVQAVTFLMALCCGALLGRAFGAAPGLEVALAGTVLCSAILFMLHNRPRSAVLLSVASLAGLVHGLAHGAEAAPGVAFIPYIAGMLAGTAVLLGAGSLLGHASALVRGTLPPRIAGTTLFVAGAAFLLQAI